MNVTVALVEHFHKLNAERVELEAGQTNYDGGPGGFDLMSEMNRLTTLYGVQQHVDQLGMFLMDQGLTYAAPDGDVFRVFDVDDVRDAILNGTELRA